jgi:hypothetical protein
MPRYAGVAGVVLLAWFAAAAAGRAQATSKNDRVERPFVSGGKVMLTLSAGTYRVEGSPDRMIRARWRTRSASDLERVRARLDVTGNEAVFRLSGAGNNFGADITLPERCDLVLTLTAGDLTVRRIEGSKDIDLWAGDVTIEVGDSARYRRVDASVRAGDITAEPFRISKGGLFRSFEYAGKGPYDLRVRLFAGDLKLVR